MRPTKVNFNKRIVGLIFFIIILSATTFSFAQNKTVVIPLFESESTATEVSFCVKRDAEYDWPDTASNRTIDFSSNSTVWSNIGGGWNTVGNVFIAPASGVYTFNGAIHFRGIAAGDLIYAAIMAGGKFYHGTWKDSSGRKEIVHVSITVHLNTGDRADLMGYASTTSSSSLPASVYGNTNTSNAFTYFMGARVF